MLVLTRKFGEKIIIQCGAETIVLTQLPKGAIGFEAPDTVKIYREEVYKQLNKKEGK